VNGKGLQVRPALKPSGEKGGEEKGGKGEKARDRGAGGPLLLIPHAVFIAQQCQTRKRRKRKAKNEPCHRGKRKKKASLPPEGKGPTGVIKGSDTYEEEREGGEERDLHWLDGAEKKRRGGALLEKVNDHGLFDLFVLEEERLSHSKFVIEKRGGKRKDIEIRAFSV